MSLWNKVGLFTRRDLNALEWAYLRHSAHVAKIANHAMTTGYVPPKEIAPYLNKRYHLDRLIATIKIRAPRMAKMMNL